MSLMQLFLQTSLAQNHPTRNMNHCINRKQTRKQCRECIEACPRQVYCEDMSVKPKWTECENCGLCVSACSANCIAPSTDNLKRQFQIPEGNHPIEIICAENGIEIAGRIVQKNRCLAVLPWTYLAYLALLRPLILHVEACDSCPHPENVERLRKQLSLLQLFLGKERFAKQVTLDFQETKRPPVEISRRDFFKSTSQKTIQGTANLLTNPESGHYEGLFYRQMPADLIRVRYRETPPEERRPYSIHLPWFRQNCYACGNCVKLCPNQALEVSEETEGKRTVSITPLRCTGCGVCQEICRENAIEEIRPVSVPHLDRLPLVTVASETCTRCHRPIRPGSADHLCASCRQKKSKR